MNRAATLSLAPVTGLYGLVVNRRNGLYRRRILRPHRVDATVISVGNITVGGTGKTPLVAWIARMLADENHKVCILSRGYGRRTKARVVVSDGRNLLAGVAAAGDEPLLLAEQLAGRAAVVCDADRIQAAHWAIDTLESDVFILDDGFQHRRLARDLDIVVIDATDPWGNGKLLPAGRLREPLSELTRAQCIVISRAENEERLPALQAAINKLNPDAPLFLARTNLDRIHPLCDELPETDLPLGPVGAFCGLGNPKSFFSLLQRRGHKLIHTRAFRDHYPYKQSDIDRLERSMRAAGAQALLTTAKDAVKLRSLKFELPCYVAEISLSLDPEEDFRELLRVAAGNKHPVN